MPCAKYNLQSERTFETPCRSLHRWYDCDGFGRCEKLDSLDQSLNKSAREIQACTSVNKLPTNEDKTEVLTITRTRLKSKLYCELSVRTDSHNTQCNVESAALLDLETDSKLSFNAPVNEICEKLASRIAVLRKIRAFLPLSQRVKYYNAVILPVMSYASVI